jgi:hypothetical protein
MRTGTRSKDAVVPEPDRHLGSRTPDPDPEAREEEKISIFVVATLIYSTKRLIPETFVKLGRFVNHRKSQFLRLP